MAINLLDCNAQSDKNFYQTDCDSVFKEIGMIICTKNGVELPATFSTTEINDLIQSKRAYPIPVVTLNADNSADTVTEEVNGIMFDIKEGERRYKLQVKANVCSYDALISLEGTFKNVYLIDKGNRLGGIIDQANDKILPIPLNSFRANPKPILMNGTESVKYLVDIRIDGEYIRNNPFAYIKPATPIYFPAIDGLKDVVIGDGTGSTTSKLIVTAVLGCGGTHVTGLVDGDFKITKDADGSDVSVTSVAEVGNTYEITATTTAGDYKVGLKTPATQTSGLYESNEVTITVS